VASRLGASGPSPTLADPCPDVAGTALADVTANGTPAVVILLGPANAPTQALVLASVDCRQLLSVTLGP
jgi:hypothetical protein